jgi:exodeoxyribonuclease-3
MKPAGGRDFPIRKVRRFITMNTFKIATYNVNSIRSRLHIVIPWLRENRPDALCMQETKVEDEKFPVKDFEGIGYYVTFSGKQRYNGVAIASLEKPGIVRCGLDDDPPDTDRLIMGVFSDVTVLNLYVPQGRDIESQYFLYKLRWFERLRGYLERNCSPEGLLVCCGDINVAAEEIDVHSPDRLKRHVDFAPEIREAFDMLKSWGLVDVFRKHHPGEKNQYSFFDYRIKGAIERGLGWRVDHILATPSMAEKSIDCSIDINPRLAEKPSDHTVMVAEFK